MTPEQSNALATAAAALTKRIANLQKAIEDRESGATLHQQLGEARGLHEALTDVLAKAEGVDPRAQAACRKLGELLDGLARAVHSEEPE